MSTHPKGKSATKSSASSTSNVPGDTPVQFVKGVGPRLASVFRAREIETVRDLLTFFPRAYEDRSKMRSVSELQEGERATVTLQVVGSRSIPLRSGKRMFEVRCVDPEGNPLALKYFHLPRGLDQKFKPGAQFVATGTVKNYLNRLEMSHPELSWGSAPSTAPSPVGKTNAGEGLPLNDPQAAERDFGRIIPVYTEIEGVPTRSLRKILWEAVQKYAHQLEEDLPLRLRDKYGLPKLGEAIRSIHFPTDQKSDGKSGENVIADLLAFRSPFHTRLIYEEFLKFELVILRHRKKLESEGAFAFGRDGGADALTALRKLLPFPLTGDQNRCVEEIMGDLGRSHPMNRLIQGDVGSGKTVVAFLTAGAVLAEGGQATLMAPTEILAEQHYKNAIKLFGGRLNTMLLTGRTGAADRRAMFARLEAGEPTLLVGTHALIEDPVRFRSLRYVMIDEQHRFGVEQRRVLREKGLADGPDGRKRYPHQLSLSATPIPRTLALTAYGDLEVSTVKEMPPGRSPVRTQVIRGEARRSAYEMIRLQVREGHQAYFIYPLVNESEAEGFTSLKSASQEAERLAREVYPEFKVGLLHGQMKPDEKQKVMESFQRNETQILVSTTVVEVGVDVPNATVMAIEHCERFGLSQLHQLRGRVGRGSAQSHCFLFTHQNAREATESRLEVLEETTDGFRIAEADLEIRGPGEFLGTRQSGGLPFRMANLVRDQDWLLKAREDAQSVLAEDAEFTRPENAPLRAYFEREGRRRLQHFGTT